MSLRPGAEQAFGVLRYFEYRLVATFISAHGVPDKQMLI